MVVKSQGIPPKCPEQSGLGINTCLVGGFKDFLFSPLLGEMILFD